MKSKHHLRKKYKKIRDAIPLFVRKKASRIIASKLFKLKKFKEAKRIGLYADIGSEVETEPIRKKAILLKKEVFYPKMSQNQTLNFYKIKNWKKEMHPGRYGILEPITGLKKISPKKLELLIVPGIAFDRNGYRLGYGKGFYDRLLKENPEIYSIGLSYYKTLLSSLPHHSYDHPLHCVLTERGIIYKKRI